MPYFLNTSDEQRAMLEAIGAGSIEELFAMVPAELRLGRPLCVPRAMGELELTRHMTALAGRNASADSAACFLGGGSYDHFIPSVVDFIAARSEFYTSYTPYQAEVAQGNLQAIFEYQTLVTQLTGMDVSNSSLYDGGSATTEAVLMAMHATQRTGRVVTTRSVHPEYRQILATYLENLNVELVTLDTPEGGVSPADWRRPWTTRRPACSSSIPNFFGCLEEMETIAEIAHRPGRVGRGLRSDQPRPAQAAGRLRGRHRRGRRAMPGQPAAVRRALSGHDGLPRGIRPPHARPARRPVGRSPRQAVLGAHDANPRTTHPPRQGHQQYLHEPGAVALRAAVYLAAMGPGGLRDVAELCLHKARYAAERLTAAGLVQPFAQPTFKEFVVRVPGGASRTSRSRLRQNIFAGVPLGRWYPELADCLLIAVTEKRTKAEIDRLAAVATSASTPQPEHRQHALLRTSSAQEIQHSGITMRNAKPKLLFELSKPACRSVQLPECDVPVRPVSDLLPRAALAAEPLPLPELPEPTLVRHFVNLSTLNMSVDTHFYPLGSCTMKYNPKRNERLAGLPGLVALHPYQPESSLQGMLELLYNSQQILAEIAGLDAVSLQPAAGAHGEFTALLVAAAYFRDLGQKRSVVLIPDGAHGTNPASATMAGFRTLPVKSTAEGFVDIDDLAAARRAGGRLHDYQSEHAGHVRAAHRQIARMVHDKGGLVYLDGANMNAILGITRPGDFGADLMHFNPHKTFSGPHGGGGPAPAPSPSREAGSLSAHAAGGSRRSGSIASTSIGRNRSAGCGVSSATPACWCGCTATFSPTGPRGCAASPKTPCSMPTTC